jgi:tetratricopeptide (TPR) repeat protein
VVFVADDLAAWLTGVLAGAGLRKLTSLVLGSDQERALAQAVTAAVQRTAAELRPHDKGQAAELAMAVSEVFGEPAPGMLLQGQQTLLERLSAGIAAQLAVLDDASLTGTGQSSAGSLDMPGAVVASTLTGHLVREIVTRGARGGPLFPLASQLNDDLTHLQGQQLGDRFGQLADQVREALARLDASRVTAVPTALAQLPAPAAGFAGRAGELAMLADLLDPAGSASMVAVAGLAGVGKTALAVAAGHAARRRGWFGGGMLFIDLHGYDDQPVQPGQALDSLLRALGVQGEHIPPDTENRAGLYRSTLAQIDDPILVIADNASSEAQVRLLQPGTGLHKVLVTSRHTLAGLDARLVDVTALSKDASAGLLEKALRAARPADDRIAADPAAAMRLAGACGGLPLALQITASLLKADPGLSTAELAGQLSDPAGRLPALRYDDGSGSASVATAFGLSVQRLDETAGQLFRLLAICPGPDVSTQTSAVLAGMQASRVRMVLADLARAHLIEPAPGMPGRWQIHDLVRLYGGELSDARAEDDGRDQAIGRLLGYYLDMAGAADAHLRALPGMAVPDRFSGRDDALAWLDGERASLVAAVSLAASIGHDHAALKLPLALTEYFDWRHRSDDWLATAAISLDTGRRLGDQHRQAEALNSLGLARYTRRQFGQTIAACRDAADIYHDIGDRYGEAEALTSLGVALRSAYRAEEASIACQRAVDIFRETGDRNREGHALTNLGYALQGTRRFGEAVTACQEAARIHHATGDRNREGSALTNLGYSLYGARRFGEAVTACQEAARIHHATGDQLREADALMNLAFPLCGARRFGEAITACQEALVIAREHGDRNREADALTNLGNALHGARRSDDAITACQRAAGIYRDIDNRRDEAWALTTLGRALSEVSQPVLAVAACQKAATIYGEIGDRHGQAEALVSLGLALTAAHRPQDAIIACQRAADIYHDSGDRHGQGVALNSLGITLREVRRFGEAISAFRNAATIFNEADDEHDERAALANLEMTMIAQRA